MTTIQKENKQKEKKHQKRKQKRTLKRKSKENSHRNFERYDHTDPTQWLVCCAETERISPQFLFVLSRDVYRQKISKKKFNV